MVVGARAGVWASRTFHQADNDPWGSASISTAGPSPAASAATAIWAASVVLPAPPFWLARTITCILAFCLNRIRSFQLTRKHEKPQIQRFRACTKARNLTPASRNIDLRRHDR